MGPFTILLLVFLNGAKCARILGVFQMPAVSHQRVFQPIWRELSLRGHEVVVVTPYPLKDPSLVNLTEMDVFEPNDEIMQRHGFEFFMSKENSVHSKIQKIFDLNYELAEAVFSNKEFMKIYGNAAEKFDLVIAQTYVAPTLYSLAARFEAPLIGVSSMGGWIESHFAMGNPNPPSLYSEMFLPFHGSMTFYQRLRSTLYNLWTRYFYQYQALPKCDSIARNYLGNSIPYLGDIERNMSLMFLTTNPFLYTPRPTVPTVISLEQMHVQPVKELPRELKRFLDEAKDGVIYFSLGSNVKSINIPKRLRNILTDAFAELPYKVLWKFESDNLPRQPNNVIIRKWLPQGDVLAHPNIKAFISQCGLQSTEEAVSRGVPIVAIPFIADQEMNAKRLAEAGVALEMDYVTLSKNELKAAIVEVAENQKYRNNMKKLQSLWVDQPMKSLDRAIWWIEYVLRHNGTKHLRSPTVNVSWFEYLLVDVVLGIIFGVSFIFFILYKVFRFCFTICRSKVKED